MMHAVEVTTPRNAQQIEPGPERLGAGVMGAWLARLGWATNLLNAIGSVWIFGLMCMMLSDLGSRFVFNRPIDGVAEVAGLSIVGIVYLQLAAAVRSGRMTRADFIADWVARKLPRFGHLLTGVFQLLGAATMAGVAYVSFGPFVSAWADSEMLGTSGVFQVATWPFRGMVLLGTAMAGICYLTLALRDFARIVSPGTPV